MQRGMMYPVFACKKEIIAELERIINKLGFSCDVVLETPPEGFGDFAFPCFSLAPQAKKSPAAIAETLAQQFSLSKWVQQVKVKGGYLNFYVNTGLLQQETLQLILKSQEGYGRLSGKKQNVIIEHTSANPNGPLHVGRARNPIIGDTLVRIFRAAGYLVESQFYLDDMGKQVAILAWGVQHLNSKDVSESGSDKPDHKLVGFYQQANKLMNEKPEVNREIIAIIKNSEQGKQETLDVIHASYKPVLDGINSSLNRINIHIDSYVPESRFVQDASVEQVISKLKQHRHCAEENGAYFLDLASFGVQGRNTKFFFQRADGTSLYATRDIAYHLWKGTQAKKLINILGEDHKLESQQVAIALQLLGAKTLPHPVFYSFVSLPGGKMSTRRGRVVYLDDLIDECVERAYQEVKKRRGDDLSERQMRQIAETVGIGSLRYNIIKVQPEKDIVFKWEEALNFEGNAVPFIQYSHARACSILAKTSETKQLNWDASHLKNTAEIQLIKQLSLLPQYIEEAANGCKPHLIPTFLYETASKFNQFYRDCPVLNEPNPEVKNARIALVDATRIVIQNGLDLLGIIAPKEM